MPEGDTIHRTARTLATVLEGKTVEQFHGYQIRSDLKGAKITQVEARGKHLLIHFDNRQVLQSHMRMKGSWHVYRKNEKWRMPAHLARAIIEVSDAVAVCFLAPTVRLLSEQETDRNLQNLGPDVLLKQPEWSEAVRRLREQNSLPVGVALLNQEIVSGIGNIYKSEVLFLERINPFARVEEMDDATLHRIVERVSSLMRANLGEEWTRKPKVYKRSGKACPRCFTTIEMKRQGPQNRSTYYCPRCQHVLK